MSSVNVIWIWYWSVDYMSKEKQSIVNINWNGRRKIIDAVAISKDEVYQRLQNGSIDRNFKYHVHNSCLKAYTLKKTLESLYL